MSSVSPSSLATVESRQSDIAQQRKRAREAQMSQAEHMVKRTRVDLKAGEVGHNVEVPVPMVDRGRGIHVTSWGSSLTNIYIRHALKTSATGGQSFVRCDCCRFILQCTSNRCECYKAKRMCNSWCHYSLSYPNKSERTI